MKHLITAAAAAAVLALSAGSAVAQDFTLEPLFGTHELNGGFEPDPYIVNVVSGGAEDVGARLEGCNGFVATAPDVRVNYTAVGLPLTFAVASPEGTDVTLLINGPDGTWYCNDDVDETTLNAALTFIGPQSGQYDIWVGTYAPGENFEAALAVTELVGDGSAPLAEYSIGIPYDDAGALTPDVSLVTGFQPDPIQIEAWAGGTDPGEAYGCIGWYAVAGPTLVVEYQAGDVLPLIISASSAADTTLMVVDPSGQMTCDDDSGNGDFNPSISYAQPLSGYYLVHLGTYAPSEGAPALLSVSELYSQ